MIKKYILKLEFIFTGFSPVRWLVILLAFVVSRTLWVWGRLRFSALVRDRGEGCVCHWSTDLKYPERIHLGKHVVIGVNVSLGAHSSIYIGNYVRISKDVQIETAGLDFTSSPPPYKHLSKSIVIEEGVWVGSRSIILGGVRIGKHAVVAAGSIVTRDVPPRTVVAGAPATVIRKLSHIMENSY